MLAIVGVEWVEIGTGVSISTLFFGRFLCALKITPP